MEPKKIYKSPTNRMIAGVAAGFAEYLNMDPTIVRLIWVALVLFAGTGILAYIICAFVIEEHPDYPGKNGSNQGGKTF